MMRAPKKSRVVDRALQALRNKDPELADELADELYAEAKRKDALLEALRTVFEAERTGNVWPHGHFDKVSVLLAEASR